MINEENLNVNNKKEEKRKTKVKRKSIEAFDKTIDDLTVEIRNEEEQSFMTMIPQIHKPYVKWIIVNQFDGIVSEYMKTVPLFRQKFTVAHRAICNDHLSPFNRCDSSRQKKKEQKQLILWSAQLLKLMGRLRAKYLHKALVTHYWNDITTMEAYAKQYRLLSANGRIRRLPTLESKQKQKIGQIVNISEAICRIAENKGFTFSLVTLTVPPRFHSNPTMGRDSFDGSLPSEGMAQLRKFWVHIRARLAAEGYKAGEHYFGCQTVEGHKSSSMHLHSLLYHSKDDTHAFHRIIRSVQAKHNKNFRIWNEPKLPHLTEEQIAYNKSCRVNFDIKLDNGKARGATYVYKYITKTNAVYSDDDDTAVKNTALRYFYGVKGFSFFGIKNCISLFNFIHNNYFQYKHHFNRDLRKVFEDRDYESFINRYVSFFKSVYYKDESGKDRLLGVEFNTDANYSHLQLMKRNAVGKKSCRVLLEKNVYSAFEVNHSFVEKDTKQEIISIGEVDLSDIINSNISFAYELVKTKQEEYDKFKSNYIIEVISNGNRYIEVKQSNDSNNSKFTVNDYGTTFESLNSFARRFLHLKNLIQVTAGIDYEKPKPKAKFVKFLSLAGYLTTV